MSIERYVSAEARPGDGPPPEAPDDAEAILEAVFRHLREPCTLADAREARIVVAHHLNAIKKARALRVRGPAQQEPDQTGGTNG
jgi:hypothetical protein